ncbi:hypothetical protein, partial [Mesorhizobium silamurunense]
MCQRLSRTSAWGAGGWSSIRLLGQVEELLAVIPTGFTCLTTGAIVAHRPFESLHSGWQES